MPSYDYRCNACGEFEQIRPLVLRNDPAACPICTEEAERVFAGAPHLALMDVATRSATSINERARHEPQSSANYPRLKHRAGCGCCSEPANRRGATVTTASGAKTAPSRRPWMISH